MAVFQRGETVVMSLEIKDSAGIYVDPATVPMVKVTDPSGSVLVNDLAMIKDAVGKYHYDYTPGDTAGLGVYEVRYKAIDGLRTTKLRDSFVVEEG
jgi:hypothetical protein